MVRAVRQDSDLLLRELIGRLMGDIPMHIARTQYLSKQLRLLSQAWSRVRGTPKRIRISQTPVESFGSTIQSSEGCPCQ